MKIVKFDKSNDKTNILNIATTITNQTINISGSNDNTATSRGDGYYDDEDEEIDFSNVTVKGSLKVISHTYTEDDEDNPNAEYQTDLAELIVEGDITGNNYFIVIGEDTKDLMNDYIIPYDVRISTLELKVLALEQEVTLVKQQVNINKNNIADLYNITDLHTTDIANLDNEIYNNIFPILDNNNLYIYNLQLEDIAINNKIGDISSYLQVFVMGEIYTLRDLILDLLGRVLDLENA